MKTLLLNVDTNVEETCKQYGKVISEFVNIKKQVVTFMIVQLKISEIKYSMNHVLLFWEYYERSDNFNFLLTSLEELFHL